MHVVATAGHVDHGKSTLVKALTGMEPDRLEEERRRGLSIELGYCWTELPGVGDVAFVDVPGHERFIATALAGVGPVPVVMFVVAADDPWMPQAAEHLAALHALGVSRGVLVVTRSDLTDPAPALARARQELAATSLREVPDVAVSGRTGAGLDRLRETLAAVLADVPTPDPDEDTRLWVDRRFHVRGAGTVVTGTLLQGRISVGDTLASGDALVRVRGLECLERPTTVVGAVARVALDLGGRAPDDVRRGTALTTPHAFEPTTTVDVRLTGPDHVPDRPVLHVGSALQGVHVRPLGPGLVRLRLDGALPLRVGDRAVLRDPGSRALWGVRVLDPAPPDLSRRGAAQVRAKELADHDGSLATELRIREVVRRSQLRRIGVPVDPLPDGCVSAGDWVIAPERAAQLRSRLEQLVRATPVSAPRPTPSSAAHALGLPTPELVTALVAPPLHQERGELSTEEQVAVPEEWRPMLARLRDDLDDNPFAAPDAGRLRELGLDGGRLARLHRDGHVLRLADNVVLLPGADDLAIDLLAALPQPFTTSQARQALTTSRRVVLPLLAHLDRTRRTVRLPDDTRRLR